RADKEVLPLQRHDYTRAIVGVSTKCIAEQPSQCRVHRRDLLGEMIGVQAQFRDEEWIDRARSERSGHVRSIPAEIFVDEHCAAGRSVQHDLSVFADQLSTDRIDVPDPLATVESPPRPLPVRTAIGTRSRLDELLLAAAPEDAGYVGLISKL